MIQGQFERAKYILTEIKGIDSKLYNLSSIDKSIGNNRISLSNPHHAVYINNSQIEKTITLLLKAYLEDSKAVLQAEFDAL